MWDSVSRIDLAVTVRLPVENPDLGRLHYDEALSWYTRHPRAARPSFHGDGDGGYTLYLGDRTSDRFLRCYNKAAESAGDPVEAEHYQRCWRYELESKGQTAYVLAGSLAALPQENRPRDVQAYVWDYVNAHGMLPVFGRTSGQKLAGTFRRRSDRDSKLAWLSRTVKPTLEWLSQTGNVRDVYESLGLPFDSAPGENGQSGEANLPDGKSD
jgi:DNA relaxase NicK